MSFKKCVAASSAVLSILVSGAECVPLKPEVRNLLAEASRDEIRDIREGEMSLSVLYREIVCEKARLAGEPIPEKIAVPFMLDLQMNTEPAEKSE